MSYWIAAITMPSCQCRESPRIHIIAIIVMWDTETSKHTVPPALIVARFVWPTRPVPRTAPRRHALIAMDFSKTQHVSRII